MKRRYSSDFSPPAPMVALLVRVPDGVQGTHIEGKIDSGADLCALPEDVIAELDLAPVRLVRAAGFGGVFQEVMLYHCAVELGGHCFEHVEAVGTRRRHAIIGRNVLRELVVKLDGPRRMLTIDPGRRRPRQKPSRTTGS